MTLPGFELVRPSTTREVAEALLSRPGARCLSGGTDLLVALSQGLSAPAHLIDLMGVGELQVLEECDGELVIGASVPLQRLRRHLLETGEMTAVSEALGVLASPVLRNMGTVGGNVCLEPRCVYYNRTQKWRQRQGFCLRHEGSVCQAAPRSRSCYAAFSADLPPALIAQGARVDICALEHGELSCRTLALEELYTGDGAKHLSLDAGEFVARVRVPVTGPPRGEAGDEGHRGGWINGYEKCRWRGSIDFPAVGVAVALAMEDGCVRGARIALAGVDPAPLVAREAAERLVGQRPGAAVFNDAAEVVAKGARIVNNHATGAGYRRRVSKALFVRLCHRLCGVEGVSA